VLGVRELLGPVGERLRVARYALANVLPGQHIGILAPVGWPVEELGATCDTATMPHAGQLTPREREVLQLAAEGLSTPAIAERLTLSPSTVTTHFNNVYVKLDVPRRSAAVAKALRLGFIE
jgi:DNA-binding CsgD family transcriptional regulator